LPKPEFKVLPVLTRETFLCLMGVKLIPQKKKTAKKESGHPMRAWKKCKGASSVPPLHFYQCWAGGEPAYLCCAFCGILLKILKVK